MFIYLFPPFPEQLSKLSRRKSKALEGSAGGERSWHNNGHAHGHWFSDVMSNGGAMEVTLNIFADPDSVG
jgi:hypothetical protein